MFVHGSLLHLLNSMAKEKQNVFAFNNEKRTLDISFVSGILEIDV